MIYRSPCLLKIALLLLHVGQVNFGFFSCGWEMSLFSLGTRGREHVHQSLSHWFTHRPDRSANNSCCFLVAKSVEDDLRILPQSVLNINFVFLVSRESCNDM